MVLVKCIRAPSGLGCCPFLGGGSVVDSLLIVTPIVDFRNCSLYVCRLLYVHSSFAIILMRKRELVALLSLLPGVSRLLCALPRSDMGLSAVCDCGIS